MDMLRSVIAAEQAAIAARRSADVLVASDLSEPVPANILLVTFPDPLLGSPENTTSGGPLSHNQFRIVIVIKNLGRTNTKIKNVCVEWSIINCENYKENPSPSIEPVYVHNTPTAIFLGGNEVISFKWSGETNGVVSLGVDQREALNTNNAWLWVWGRIIYVDFVGNEYELGFVAHWEAVAGSTIGAAAVTMARGFVIEGPPTYIYGRRRDSLA
jgi:hypothetical protein